MNGKDVIRAGALRFRAEEDRAPRLVAKGAGALAEQMIAVARESGTTVVEDPGLCAAVSELPVGKEVPENLYRVMAGLFALVYDLNQRNAG
ncbi:MAG: EscU/YscU/HrcU family type III secretion system export apparatus switch protein [bacterium]|nr:EscU/YscU/HrcU family type III secretion system export apparatus switch protein [bacterium]